MLFTSSLDTNPKQDNSLPTNKSKFGKLVLLVASNAPDSIDPSFRRGGRLDVKVEIGVPTAKARREILKRIIEDLKAHEPILSTLEDDEIHSILITKFAQVMY